MTERIERTHAASGSKYIRTITQTRPGDRQGQSVYVDVYDVIDAFAVTSPALQHALKKVLCAGIRDKATRLQDLEEARDALTRAIDRQEVDNAIQKETELSFNSTRAMERRPGEY